MDNKKMCQYNITYKICIMQGVLYWLVVQHMYSPLEWVYLQQLQVKGIEYKLVGIVP